MRPFRYHTARIGRHREIPTLKHETCFAAALLIMIAK